MQVHCSRRNAQVINDHPDIIVKPAVKAKANFVPTSDMVSGFKSK